MRRNPTWLFAILIIAAMSLGGWIALRPRETLTVLVLLQRKYENVEISADIDAGVLLAMEEVGHRASRYRLVVADRNIVPEMDFYRGPREAIEEVRQNPDVVAVLGPSIYHASEILRELNQLGVLVVGPADPQSELTKPGYGYSNYTPESYRPSGERNFYRTMPAADVVERGCAEWAFRHGARTVFVLGDNESQIRTDGFLKAASQLGFSVVGDESLDSWAHESRAMKIVNADPDLLFLRGERSGSWHGLLGAVRCLGWNGIVVARREHAEEFDEGWGAPMDGMIAVSRASPPPEFVTKFSARFGRPPGTAGWYGYLAGRAVVDAIDLANSKDRNEIRRACARLRSFDANGDTLSNELEVAVLRHGRWLPVESFTPSPPPPPAPKPRISISFEGTLKEHRGVLEWPRRGTYYIDPSKVDGEGSLTRREVEEMREAGHAVVEGPAPASAIRAPQSLDELKKIVDQALTDQKPVELVFHQIRASVFTIGSDVFDELCKYLNDKGFIVVLPGR